MSLRLFTKMFWALQTEFKILPTSTFYMEKSTMT